MCCGRCAHEERQPADRTTAADRSSALQTAELGLLAVVAAAAPLLLDVQTASAAGTDDDVFAHIPAAMPFLPASSV